MHAKNMCLKELGLYAQNMLIILHLTVNIVVGILYDQLMLARIFTLIMNKISSENYRGKCFRHGLELAIISH